MWPLYLSFRACNFRCFGDLRLEDLARINLIAGRNNVGKTALLEALDVENCQESIVKVLRVVDERVKRLVLVLGEGKRPVIHAGIGAAHLMPLSLMGEGMVRIASLALAIANARGGTVLVDEIENGFHYSIVANVWRVVAELAREVDVQVFATTHSFECIAAAHSVFTENGLYDFRLYRLEQADGNICAVKKLFRLICTGRKSGPGSRSPVIAPHRIPSALDFHCTAPVQSFR